MQVMETPVLPPIALGPSPRLALVLGAVHAVALLLLTLLPLAWWLHAVLGVLLLWSALHSIHHHALRRGADAIDRLEFSDRTALRLRTRDGRWHDAVVLGSSFVSAALIVLNLGIAGRRLPLHVVIPGDSADADELRRLRVWLRWGPQSAADTAIPF